MVPFPCLPSWVSLRERRERTSTRREDEQESSYPQEVPRNDRGQSGTEEIKD